MSDDRSDGQKWADVFLADSDFQERILNELRKDSTTFEVARRLKDSAEFRQAFNEVVQASKDKLSYATWVGWNEARGRLDRYSVT
jgi:hypothetical protein